MKKYISFVTCLCICLAMLTGCSCRHSWIEADCLTAKTCSLCGATDGEPLGHTPGQQQEITDLYACTVTQEQHCTTCNKLLSSKLTPITTLVQDGLFCFSPDEFLDRLSYIVKQHGKACIYKTLDSPLGMQVLAIHGGRTSLIQFFDKNSTTISKDEKHSRKVWCVSLADSGIPDPMFRSFFLMACDPKLSSSAASQLEWALYNNYAYADSAFGYYKENELLYEVTNLSEDSTGTGYPMQLINVYASDFLL